MWFAEHGVLMVIGFGAVEGRRITWLDALRYVFRYLAQLVRLGSQIIARLLLIVAPFLAAIGGVYLLFLGKHDINYYLADKPPEFWGAVALASLLLIGLGIIVLKKVANWIVTIPLVLFGASSWKGALGSLAA